MRNLKSLITSVVVALLLTCSFGGDAFAKRLGGGSSFGSRPSYSQPYRAPSGVNPSTPSQQPAYQNPQRPGTSPMQPRGNGFMGMLGGLAIGGLLGSMLFGHGFQGINFLDILIFAGIAFLAFKFLSGRRQSPVAASGYQTGNPGTSGNYGYQRQAEESNPAGFDTDILARRNGGAGASQSSAPVMPADFDQASFLNGAKAAYTQMQMAWDSGNLADLRALTTDKVFSELQDQLRARQGNSHTELLKVDATILEVRDLASERAVSVLFDVTMNEDKAGASQIREVWHFTRAHNSRQPNWYLDGIQQWEE